MMAFCPQCGRPVEAEDAFCPNCGEDLREESVLTEPDAHQLETVTGRRTPPANEDTAGQATDRSRRLSGATVHVLLGAVLAIGVIGLGAIAYLSFGRDFFGGQQGAVQQASSQAVMQSAEMTESSGAISSVSLADASEVASSSEASTSSTAEASLSQEKEVVVSFESSTRSAESSASSQPTAVPSRVDNQAVQAAFNQYFGGLAGQHALYFLPLTNQAGDTLEANPLVVNDLPLRSASVIKLFVLATLFQEVEAGTVSLTDEYRLDSNDIVGGTGNIQGYSPGTPLTYRDLAREMIINSDNMAMNVLVDRLGGFDAVNRTIQQLGYRQSRLDRKMMDFKAVNRGVDNYVSAAEVGDLLRRVYQQQLISPQADQQFLAILAGQTDRTNLEAQLPTGVSTYNKTGQNGNQGVRNDAAIVAGPAGAFVLVVLSQDGSEGAQIAAMQGLGRTVYQLYQP